MRYSSWAVVAFALGVGCSGARAEDETTATAETQPNIILIMADDLGYGGLNIQGDKEIPTPHIDSIAKDGIRFTSGYVSAPVCSPSRAGLLSGRHQSRFGHEMNPGGGKERGVEFGLPLSEETLADRLKEAGYTTALFGKWHLGTGDDFHPNKRGFDEFYGFLGGAHDYFKSGGNKGTNAVQHNGTPVDDMEYATDAFADKAAEFISEQDKEKPFFIFLSFNAVHTPMQALDKYIERFPDIRSQKRRVHAAMLSAMDDGVGRVLEAVDKKGATTNTLVVFISDNGGPTQSNTSTNAPLRGYKRDLLEGGIRVPFFVKWPEQVKAAQVEDMPVTALDIHATAVAIAGTSVSAELLDGENLVPHLTGKNKVASDRTLYWRFGPQWAVRKGNWKLLQPGRPGVEPLLFNLKNDIGEKRDVAARRPGKVRELQGLFDEWNKDLVEPLWAKDTNLTGIEGEFGDDDATTATEARKPRRQKKELNPTDRRARRAERKARRETPARPAP